MAERMTSRLERYASYAADAKIILELGSRDGIQAIELAELWPAARVYAFECNPAALAACRRNLAGHDRITLVEMAVAEQDGPIPFHPIANNAGASSVLVPSGDYDSVEWYNLGQAVTVPATRVDSWAAANGISTVDVVWADLQGYELAALRGMGAMLSGVRLANLELELRPIYEGQPLLPEIVAHMQAQGLALAEFHSNAPHHWWGDGIFVRPTYN
jgi:FkbM family methyltransferase